MRNITIQAVFDNVIDAQKALAEINQAGKGCVYWTNAYDGNPGHRKQVFETVGSVYGGQIGNFIGSNMDLMVYNFNNLFVAPLAISQGIFQPVSYHISNKEQKLHEKNEEL